MAKNMLRITGSKKGYIKTLEAAIALVLSFLFITYFVPANSETELREPSLRLVKVLEQDSAFRTCVLAENYPCMNSTFESYYPSFILDHGYVFNVSTDPAVSGASLPGGDIIAESLFIAGNDTFIYPKTARLYYWHK